MMTFYKTRDTCTVENVTNVTRGDDIYNYKYPVKGKIIFSYVQCAWCTSYYINDQRSDCPAPLIAYQSNDGITGFCDKRNH